MTYSCSINTRGDIKFSLFDDSLFGTRTFTTHPDGIEYCSIDDDNNRISAAYPDDGDMGADIIVRNLKDIRENVAPKDALLSEVVSKLLERAGMIIKEV